MSEGTPFSPTTAENAAYKGAPGDVVLNVNSAANTLPTYAPGSAGWFLILHETGHALGLKHPHDDGGTGRPTLSQIGLGVLDVDTISVMSYNDDLGFSSISYDPATPMLLDVIGLQYLYGPNMSKNAGDGVYTLSTTSSYLTIWDAGGHDEVSAFGSDRGWRVVLPSYDYANGRIKDIGYALPSFEYDYDMILNLRWLIGTLEDANGSNFNDSLIGNGIGNILAGNGGADFLDGGAGSDSLLGGSGADVVLGGAGNDLVDGGTQNDSLYGEAGRDTLLGKMGTDSVDGGAGNDWVRGGQGDDTVMGGSGDDWIWGDRGNDTISGGAGADLFHAASGAGIDRITDFSFAAGDRLKLEGNPSRTIAQAGADVVVDMGNGDQVILVGVSLASLGAGWIL